MSDPRFSAMHTSSLFNMVPSEQHARKKDSDHGLKRHKDSKFKPSSSGNFQKKFKKARHH